MRTTLELLRELLHRVGRRPGNRLGEIEALALLRLAEVRRVEQLLEADDLRALVGGFADARDRALDVLVDVVRDCFLYDSYSEKGEGDVAMGERLTSCACTGSGGRFALA